MLEPYLGFIRYAVLYWVSGIFSSIFSMIFFTSSPGLGASGADFGIIAMYVIYVIKGSRRLDKGNGAVIVPTLAILGYILMLVSPMIPSDSQIPGEPQMVCSSWRLHHGYDDWVDLPHIEVSPDPLEGTHRCCISTIRTRHLPCLQHKAHSNERNSQLLIPTMLNSILILMLHKLALNLKKCAKRTSKQSNK
jgi:hypothetical protein